MKKRVCGMAVALIAASCFLGSGYAVSKKSSEGKTVSAFAGGNSDFQGQVSLSQPAEVPEIITSCGLSSLSYYSNNSYIKLTSCLKYALEQLSELEEGSGGYETKIKEINGIWGQLSILAGELNSQFATESSAEPVKSETAIMINNYFEQSKNLNSLAEEVSAPLFLSGFFKFLQLRGFNCAFSFSVV